ncbi:MAG: class I SAM-dependent RNA methyltransferase [Paracoccaceae bacterium]
MDIYTIDRLGHEGDGIATTPQGAVYAPFTLPGEVVSGRLEATRLLDVQVQTPAPARVAAPCVHFTRCGGCSLQHASDAFLADWKQDVVQRALTAQGLEAEFRAVQTSPDHSRRRATFSARRTRKTEQIGFFEGGSEVLVDLVECHILRPALMAARPTLAAITRTGGSRNGVLRLTVMDSCEGLDIAVSGGKPLDITLRTKLAAIAEADDIARLTWGEDQIALRRRPVQPFGRALVAPPPGAFLQATAQGEAALLAAVRDAIGPAKRVVDLFAGCGTFSLPLAATAEVLAIEGDAAMVAALDRGWREAKGLHRVEAVARDLFRRPLLPAEVKTYDAVVIDPPRAGAAAQMAELALSAIARVAAVSCSPVTFARDAKTLCDAGFSLDWVQVVDQFRWSGHVELAAQFSR